VAKRKTFIALCTELTKLWNTLPEDITSAPFLLVFRRKLKTHLFRQSYPDIILQLVWHVAPGGP